MYDASHAELEKGGKVYIRWKDGNLVNFLPEKLFAERKGVKRAEYRGYCKIANLLNSAMQSISYFPDVRFGVSYDDKIKSLKLVALEPSACKSGTYSELPWDNYISFSGRSVHKKVYNMLSEVVSESGFFPDCGNNCPKVVGKCFRGDGGRMSLVVDKPISAYRNIKDSLGDVFLFSPPKRRLFGLLPSRDEKKRVAKLLNDINNKGRDGK